MSIPAVDLSPENIAGGLSTAFIGRQVVYYPSTGSTNDEAKRLAGEGAAEGTLVIADRQTAGKGRLGRQWLAPPGTSLLLSLVFRPALSPAQAQRLTMICSLAAVEAIAGVTGLPAAVKWPNDVVLGNRKAGGILTELGISGQRLEYAVVGMGLNVNVDFAAASEPALAALSATATSLRQELGREVSRLELLWALLEGIEARYLRLRAGWLPHEEWAAHLATIGREVRVSTPQEQVDGRAEGVDADGALLLRTPDGSLRRILAGDVTLRATRT